MDQDRTEQSDYQGMLTNWLQENDYQEYIHYKLEDSSLLLNSKDYYTENNYLEEFPSLLEEVLIGLNLTKLELGGWDLTFSIESFSKFESLEELILKKCSFALGFPDQGSFGDLTGLKRLTLEECDLMTFPKIVLNLTNLTYLNLQFNALKNIPPTLELEQLANLQELILTLNEFKLIPLTIRNLKNLEKLYLNENNHINKIPEQIQELKNLKELNISGNFLDETASTIMLNDDNELQDEFLSEIDPKVLQLRPRVNQRKNYIKLKRQNELKENIALYNQNKGKNYV